MHGLLVRHFLRLRRFPSTSMLALWILYVRPNHVITLRGRKLSLRLAAFLLFSPYQESEYPEC
jgi:hypothetical protein